MKEVSKVIKSFSELLAHLKAEKEKRAVAVVAAQDSHTLEAVIKASQDGLVDPVLLGDSQEIIMIIQSLGRNELDFDIRDIKDSEDCAREAARLVSTGRINCIMKGKIETGPIMKVLMEKECNLRIGQLMSIVATMEVPTYHKLMAISDVGLMLYPTLEQKKALIENALVVFNALGISRPKVGIMAAVEKVNPKMKETLDADTLKRWNQEGLLSGCIVEGPISYDLAVDGEAAATKGYNSPVAGDVDLMIVPDIVSGNLLAKVLTCSAGARTAGIVVGAKVPLVITSRSATMDDKYMSLALAALVGEKVGGVGNAG